MEHSTEKKDVSSGATLTLRARPERKMIRTGGGECAIDFHIQVGSIHRRPERAPLRLALVLDRSGSMQGEKLRIARRATLAVLDQLTARDNVAVTVFDDRIDVVQAMAQVTPALKNQVRAALDRIEARANTALHEGWLTGCNSIVSDAGTGPEDALARCFLLTDGIANVGVTDPERIAGEAAGVREHTGISTSTFGIGQDYNELLLGPMAVAGGGQFHHLRTPDEILNTFIGELGELLSIAVRQVHLEVEVESGLGMELISAHWLDAARGSIALGDLQQNEEQHVVIRVRFPAQWNSERRTVRARLVWLEGRDWRQSEWQKLQFLYAADDVFEAEPLDPDVVHWISLQEADHARREAIALNNRGDLPGARLAVQRAMERVRRGSSVDNSLEAELNALGELQNEMSAAPLSPSVTKEQYYQQQRRSRSKADYRRAGPDKQDREKL